MQDDFGDLPALMQTFYRNYDQALGRWTGVDPDAESTELLSVYNYSGNNPVMFNDPLGNLMDIPALTRFEQKMRDLSVYNDDGSLDFDKLERLGESGGGSTNAQTMQSEAQYNALLAGSLNIYHAGRDDISVVSNLIWASIAGGSITFGDNGFWALTYNRSFTDASGTALVGESGISEYGRFSQVSVNQSATPWMNYAGSQLGVSETTGHNDGPDVDKYLATAHIAGSGKAWCGCFVNWSLQNAGIKGIKEPARAFGWKNYGQTLNKPAYGAIVVMNYSHVGFLAGFNKDGRIILLGGNQGRPGGVTLSPNSPDAVISYQYPIGYTPNYNVPSYNLKGPSSNFNSSR